MKRSRRALLLCAFPSHPVRVRGLKHVNSGKFSDGKRSHPVRVRGLKHDIWKRLYPWMAASHPVRVRGLKHV